MKDLTIMMPCLNEAETVGICITRAKELLADHQIDGEILISDNGSIDGSREIAFKAGARVVDCPARGYGAALQFGIENAEGQFILMGDSDDSYHFDEAWPMIEKLQNGYDVCMGTRLKGKIMPYAMPTLNRYLGNPILSGIGKIFFKTDLSDFHCGMRAFRRDKIIALNLTTVGMEWASEMVIKSQLAGLNMTEVPVTLYKDGRSRSPHLRRWRDGWRHLRFMLLHAPNWLFIVPGLILVSVGLPSGALLTRGMIKIGNATFDVHSLLVMAFMVILGVQMVFTGLFANLYSHTVGLLPRNATFEKNLRRFTLEKLLIISLILGGIGSTGLVYTFWKWYAAAFPRLNYEVTMRWLIPSLTLIAVAIQGVFNGFMLSVLFLKTDRKHIQRSAD